MNLLLVALLLATQAPGAQDTAAQVLLRLEDDWTVGLTHRDAALFRRFWQTDSFTRKTIAPSVATTCCAMWWRDRTRSRRHTTRIWRSIASARRLSSRDGWWWPATDPRERSVAAIGSRTPGYGGAGIGRSSRHTITLCPRGSATHRAP